MEKRTIESIYPIGWGALKVSHVFTQYDRDEAIESGTPSCEMHFEIMPPNNNPTTLGMLYAIVTDDTGSRLSNLQYIEEREETDNAVIVRQTGKQLSYFFVESPEDGKQYKLLADADRRKTEVLKALSVKTFSIPADPENASCDMYLTHARTPKANQEFSRLVLAFLLHDSKDAFETSKRGDATVEVPIVHKLLPLLEKKLAPADGGIESIHMRVEASQLVLEVNFWPDARAEDVNHTYTELSNAVERLEEVSQESPPQEVSAMAKFTAGMEDVVVEKARDIGITTKQALQIVVALKDHARRTLGGEGPQRDGR